MLNFLGYYPAIYTKEQLQAYVVAGLMTQEQVDARVAEVEAASGAEADELTRAAK